MISPYLRWEERENQNLIKTRPFALALRDFAESSEGEFLVGHPIPGKDHK